MALGQMRCSSCLGTEGTVHPEPTVTWWRCSRCGDEWVMPEEPDEDPTP